MSVCLCYLTREREGLKRFAAAYRDNDPGADHTLLLLMKGVDLHRPALELFKREPVFWPVWDLGNRSLSSFRDAANNHKFSVFCFLNSWSRPLCDGWLKKLCAPLSDSVALTGCTASMESFQSNGRKLLNRLIPKFPNPHLRTNAFACTRRDALALLPRFAPFAKLEYLSEAGRRSISQKVWRSGRKVALVGRYGHSTEAQDWKDLETFRSGEQSGLLVADNKTDTYTKADSIGRKRLIQIAWGGSVEFEPIIAIARNETA